MNARNYYYWRDNSWKGQFIDYAVEEQENFYESNFSGEHNYAFTKRIMESSPLQRVIETLSPGAIGKLPMQIIIILFIKPVCILSKS